MTLRTRILGCLLLVATAVIVVFDLATTIAVQRLQTDRLDAVLDKLVVSHQYRAAELLQAAVRTTKPTTGQELIPVDFSVMIITGDGRAVAVSDPPHAPPALPADLAEVARTGRVRTVGSSDGGSAFRLRATMTDVGILVAVGNLRSVIEAVHQVRAVLAVSTVVAMVVLAACGTVVLRHGLRPLEAIAEQADRITAGEDLTRPVVPQRPDTEVGRLGAALNRMLARIQASIEEQRDGHERTRRFWADASHELRTPLTSVYVNAQLYQQGALTTRAQVDEAMRRIQLSARRMSGLVDDMLRLAHLDHESRSGTDAIDLTAVLADSVRDVRVIDADRTWVSRIPPGLVVYGDPDLLRRAADNLLANIRAHTPPGTTGTLTARSQGAQVVIEVDDNGPGVPESAIPRLFDRFFRVERRAVGAGSGLGLAIVAEVAASHGGTAAATAVTPHGLRIRLTLPTAPAPEPSEKTGQQVGNRPATTAHAT